MEKYLGKRGYVIIKKKFTPEKIAEVKQDLLAQPYTPVGFGKPEKPFPIYLENKNKLYLPKYYGLEKFGKPDEDKTPKGQKINLKFNGELRENQVEPFTLTLNTLKDKEKGGGILALPCGEGKTAGGCWLISQLKVKTLVLVHKEFLLNQWMERILGLRDTHAFLPGAKIGRIQGKTVDIEGKDIVIGMIQSISQKDYPLDTFDSFGLVILDECHRCPSRTFSQSLKILNSQYMLGLSATPNRNDGLTSVLKMFIGDVIFKRKSKITENSKVERYIYSCDDPKYCEEYFNYDGNLNIAKVLTNIVDFEPKTKFIFNKIIEKLDEGRTILILSERINLLKKFEEYILKTEYKNDYGFYIGGLKERELKVSEGKKLILGSFAISAEGLDIPSINTIFFVTSRSNITQSAGRIRVKSIDKFTHCPLIVDICDNFSIFKNQANKRKDFYKKNNYYVETIQVDEDGKELKRKVTYDPSVEKETKKDEKPEKVKKGKLEFKPGMGFKFTV